MAVAEVLYTKRESFTRLDNGIIVRHEGHFHPEENYLHDVYKMPPKPAKAGYSLDGTDVSEICWRRECRNVEEMNGIAKEEQRKEYRKKVKLIRKQWKAQNPTAFARMISRMMEHIRG